MLITGAGGYVGGRLVKELVSQDWDVRALVRDPTPRLGVPETVCDIASVEMSQLIEACDGVDSIVHLAGENEVAAAREPAATLASTTMATERLAEASAEAGVKRFVYLSTMHVYGSRIAEGAVLEEDLRPEPRASYAVSRLASEHLAQGIAMDAFDLVVLRLTNSLGAPDDPGVDRWTLVAMDLCRQGVTTGQLELRSSGVQWRDFVALGDVCAAIASAGSVGNSEVPPGTYNLGSGQSTTILDLTAMIQDAFEELTGDRPELRAPEHEGSRPRPYTVSVERLAAHGVRAETPLPDAVRETVEFCLENAEELR